MLDALRENVVHGNRAFPFALYSISVDTYPRAYSLHWHDEVELIYVQRGLLELTIEKTRYLGRPGDLFIVNSRQIHAMSVNQEPTQYATALFPLSSLLFQQEDEIAEKYLRPLAENQLRFPNSTASLEICDSLRERVEQILALYQGKERCYMLKIRTLLLEMLCDFFSEEGALSLAQVSIEQEKRREILGYLNENFTREIPLETVAEAFHMAPKYFSRYFKKTFHISLTEYVNRLRLEKAAHLLRHTQLPVTEIALQTGFNSSSYFNKKFLEIYEKTPTAFRLGK